MADGTSKAAGAVRGLNASVNDPENVVAPHRLHQLAGSLSNAPGAKFDDRPSRGYRQPIEARLETLIDGERDFMMALNVVTPQERTAGIIADSDASDEDYIDIEHGEADADGDEIPLSPPEAVRSQRSTT